jgi:hydroxymethylpyrimidine/phosphomethylpyrimidine kinase
MRGPGNRLQFVSMSSSPVPVVLSIAGYDPSSGAGVTADIKTVAAQGCYAVTCITGLTVQSTVGVSEVRPLELEIVLRTLRALNEDFEIAAVRLGMLASGRVATTVADFLEETRLGNVVLDPVLRSSSGTPLIDDDGVTVIRERLLSLASVVTPNIDEAAVLAGEEAPASGDSWEDALSRLRKLAGKLHGLGSKAVVVTGGHLAPPNDYLSYVETGSPVGEVLRGTRIESRSTHGTGCAFSTALACQLALGKPLLEAVRAAKEYVREAMLAAYPLGKGTGPLNHLYGWQKR